MTESKNSTPYFPPPESKGGWRCLRTNEEIKDLAGMSPEKIEVAFQLQQLLHGSIPHGIVIIRHGYLVREFYTPNVLIHTRFDTWSCTKSFTGTVWGILLEDSRQGRLPGSKKVELDSPAYPYLPEGYPLSDPRKRKILIRHLLTMTSGIPGEDSGVIGMPTDSHTGAFEHALGFAPNRYGKWADKLVAEPGTHFEYSDPAMCHLAMIFYNITGRDMRDVLQERVCAPIGIENLSWDVQGGSGFLGPRTNAHTGVHISAREFARIGYLMLHKGAWQGQQVVPQWWVEMETKSSQQLQPAYGYLWWVNTDGTHWRGLPKDAFAASGYCSSRCYVIPSLDLIIARVGAGPNEWNDMSLLGDVVASVISDQ